MLDPVQAYGFVGQKIGSQSISSKIEFPKYEIRGRIRVIFRKKGLNRKIIGVGNGHSAFIADGEGQAGWIEPSEGSHVSIKAIGIHLQLNVSGIQVDGDFLAIIGWIIIAVFNGFMNNVALEEKGWINHRLHGDTRRVFRYSQIGDRQLLRLIWL